MILFILLLFIFNGDAEKSIGEAAIDDGLRSRLSRRYYVPFECRATGHATATRPHHEASRRGARASCLRLPR